MFLITPSPKNKPNGDSSPPHNSARQTVPTRVKQACVRCRIKKIKCDGQIPCRRCTRDQVNCQLDRRDRADLKEVSRNYISSLETQQRYLLDALRQLCEHRGDMSDPGVQNILKRLEATGVEVDSIQQLDDNKKVDMRNASDNNLTQHHSVPSTHSQITTADALLDFGSPRLFSGMNLDTTAPHTSYGSYSFPQTPNMRPAPNPIMQIPNELAYTNWAFQPTSQPMHGFATPVDCERSAVDSSTFSSQPLDEDEALSMDSLLAFDSPDYANAWWESWINVTQRINAAENNTPMLADGDINGVTTMQTAAV